MAPPSFSLIFKRGGSYGYSLIDSSAYEIRLLTLLPGKFSETPRIVLNTVKLDSGTSHVPAFEAVSYTWGTTKKARKIRVEVKGRSSRSLLVTRNLYELLPYLRHHDKPRVLWIDAICINQKNKSERSQQLQRMADIFGLASRVVVWLGVERDDSSEAMEWMRSVASQVVVSAEGYIEPAQGQAAEWIASDGHLLDVSEKIRSTLGTFLYRSWFERLWVQQEAYLGSEVVMMCGRAIITFQQLRAGICCLVAKTRNIGSYLRDRAHFIYQLILGYTSHLLKIIDKARECKCSDPRDRVYALLSLSSFKESNLIKPDYSKSVLQVYQDAAAAWMEIYKSLDALIFSSYSNNNFASQPLPRPTWIPDWSQPRARNALDHCPMGSYTHGLNQARIVMGQHRLVARGVALCSVGSVTPIGIDDTSTTNDTVRALRRLIPATSICQDYVGGGRILDAYCRLFNGGIFRDDCAPLLQSRSSREKVEMAVLQCLVSAEERWWAQDAEYDLFLSGAFHISAGRCVVQTSDGHLGLAPNTAEAGDLVCILFGCGFPVILRPTVLDKTAFVLIGTCLVAGLFNGEAVLGPVPDHYKILHDVTSVGYWLPPVFRDTRNGGEQKEDPRFRLVLGDEYEEWHGEHDGSDQWHEWYDKTLHAVFDKLGKTSTEFTIV